MSVLSIGIKSIHNYVDSYGKTRMESESGFNAIESWGLESDYFKKIQRITEQKHIPITPYTLIDLWMNEGNLDYKVVMKSIQNAIKFGRKMRCDRFIVFAGDRDGKANIQKRTIIESVKKLVILTKNRYQVMCRTIMMATEL